MFSGKKLTAPVSNTTGMVLVADFVASAAGVLVAAITATRCIEGIEIRMQNGG
jgi:hypothetical protein